MEICIHVFQKWCQKQGCLLGRTSTFPQQNKTEWQRGDSRLSERSEEAAVDDGSVRMCAAISSKLFQKLDRETTFWNLVRIGDQQERKCVSYEFLCFLNNTLCETAQ